MVQPWGPGSSDLASELLWAARSLPRRCMSHRHRPSITRHLLLWFMFLHRRRCMSGRVRAAAYEKLMEAMKLLASAGLPLLAEEVEELALQVDLQTTN
jgi:hypothetical protein